jgi:hypothetical protein
VTLGPADEESRVAAEADTELVVAASGNLAMIYLTRHPGRLTRRRIDAACPGLVDGLAEHPGVGAVVVADDDGPVAVGAHGWHRLTDGTVGGQDPLTGYGPRARDDLLRHQGMDHVGDLTLIGMVDPDTEEVAAFEELVGSHGGLGGWQTEAVLLHPAGWRRDGELAGAVAVHRQLVAWLRRIGLRAPDEPSAAVAERPTTAPAHAVAESADPAHAVAESADPAHAVAEAESAHAAADPAHGTPERAGSTSSRTG